MRTCRLKAPADDTAGYYHCMSRVVDRRMIFGDTEREVFVRLMRKQALFAGVQVLAYCIMGNHFHVLIEVPRRPAEGLGDSELLERSASIYSEAIVARFRRKLAGPQTSEEEKFNLRAGLHRRMWDVSRFIQELKQRFSLWYNKQNGRVGTLWEERFRSVLVGCEGPALARIAAYIDLNPVRAGIVDDPQSYRWSSVSEAAAGRECAMSGYRRLVYLADGRERSSIEALESYRTWLYARGGEMAAPMANSTPAARRSIDPKRVRAVIEGRGQLSLSESLMCRLRFFSEGVAIGTKAFIEGLLSRHMQSNESDAGHEPFEVAHVEGPSLFLFRPLRRVPIEC